MTCDNCLNVNHPERCAGIECDTPEAAFSRKITLLSILAGCFVVLWVSGAIYDATFRAKNPSGTVMDHFYAKPYPVQGDK